MLNRNKLDWAAGYFQNLFCRCKWLSLALCLTLWLTTRPEKNKQTIFHSTENWIFFSLFEFFFGMFFVLLVVTCGAHHCLSVCRQQQFVNVLFPDSQFTPNTNRLAIFWKFYQHSKEHEYKTEKRKREMRRNKQTKRCSTTMPSALLLYICHHVNGDNFECGAGLLQQQKRTSCVPPLKKRNFCPFSSPIWNTLLFGHISLCFSKFKQTYSKLIRFTLRLDVLLCKQDRSRDLGEFYKLIELFVWL